MTTTLTRRQVLLVGGIAGAALLVGRSAGANTPVSTDDAQAKALGYTEDAATVDTAVWTRKAPGQHCANCGIYQATSDGWGTCPIFAGKLVKGAGWCNAWVAGG